MGKRTAAEALGLLYEQYDAHDPAAAAALYREDGRHVELGPETERVGRAAIAAGLERLFGAMPDVRWERDWTVAEHGRAVAGYTLTATVAGRPVRLQGVHVAEVVAGELARTADLWDRAALAAQVPHRPPAVAFAHTCVPVADLERSLSFYGDLGLELRRRFTDAAGAEHAFLAFPRQDEHLELLAAPPSAPRQAHVAWRTTGLDGLVERLAALGAHPLAPPQRTPAARICLVRDPDGHEIELVEPLSDAA